MMNFPAKQIAKAISFSLLLILAGITGFAQYRPATPQGESMEEHARRNPQEELPEEVKGFNINRVFVGGSIGLGLGFGSQISSWSIGGFPQVGYSFTDWLDAGVTFNANYNAQKYDYGTGYVERYTSFNYGTGVFVRGFPFRSVFLQVQPEFNWIAFKNKYEQSGSTLVEKQTVNAPSLLAGIGYGSRMVGSSGFFMTLMFDLMNDRYSPYRDSYNGNIIPILRGGFYLYLHKKRPKLDDYQ